MPGGFPKGSPTPGRWGGGDSGSFFQPLALGTCCLPTWHLLEGPGVCFPLLHLDMLRIHLPLSLLPLSPPSCGLKGYSQPESWEFCFIWQEAWVSASQVTLRELHEGGEGCVCAMLYRNLEQRAGSLNFKRLFLIKEKQIFQVKEFSSFLCM